MNEFEWEKSLKESDALAEKYAAALEKFKDQPDADRLVAKEMGWSWMEEALEAHGLDDEAIDEEEFNVLPPPEPDPLKEGVDWIREEDGSICHPLTAKAFENTMSLWHYCEERRLLGEGRDQDLHEMLFEAQLLGAKLAGALDHLGYASGVVEGGFVVACLKRALLFFDKAIAASLKVRAKKLLDDERLEQFRTALFAIREDMLHLMKRFRDRPDQDPGTEAAG